MAGPRRHADVADIDGGNRASLHLIREPGPDMVDIARRILAGRRALASALPAAFNSNFSLDILLMLYVDAKGRTPMPLEGIASAIGAPGPVAIRWAVALEAIGHVTLAGGVARLTDAGHEAIERGLRDLVRGEAGIVTAH